MDDIQREELMDDIEAAMGKLNEALATFADEGSELLAELEGEKLDVAPKTEMEILRERIEYLEKRVGNLEKRAATPPLDPLIRQDTWVCESAPDIRMQQYEAGIAAREKMFNTRSED